MNEMCCRRLSPTSLIRQCGCCLDTLVAVLLLCPMLYTTRDCHGWCRPPSAVGRLKQADFEKIADFLHETLELCKRTQEKHGKLLKDFNKCVTASRANTPSFLVLQGSHCIHPVSSWL